LCWFLECHPLLKINPLCAKIKERDRKKDWYVEREKKKEKGRERERER
jgi:hypothetical protein